MRAIWKVTLPGQNHAQKISERSRMRASGCLSKRVDVYIRPEGRIETNCEMSD